MKVTTRVLAQAMCDASLHGQGINTVAGTSWSFPTSSAPALSAPLGTLGGAAVDDHGNAYAADSDDNVVVRISQDRMMTVFAGNGNSGFCGDGGLAEILGRTNAATGDRTGVPEGKT